MISCLAFDARKRDKDTATTAGRYENTLGIPHLSEVQLDSAYLLVIGSAHNKVFYLFRDEGRGNQVESH